MRILWDFRLFSYGYGSRGVGVYTRYLAEAVLRENPSAVIYVWADRKKLPNDIKSWPVRWIPYTSCSWKQALYRIPYLILRYNIDIFHYWICLGPIHSVGMGLIHHCKVVGTVYDLGVELWNDVPFAESKRNTRYWYMQKKLIRQCADVLCISDATRNDLHRVIPKSKSTTHVVYAPLPCGHHETPDTREPYFITLGGSVHKNLRRTIEAFCAFKENHDYYKLIVLGDIDPEEELPDTVPGFIKFEDMSQYSFHLLHAGGLIFCSLHEGLGLPPVEAMIHGCPLLVSDIPSLKEICDQYALFVNPLDTSAITEGMEELAANQKKWITLSHHGKSHYWEMSKDSGRKVAALYK